MANQRKCRDCGALFIPISPFLARFDLPPPSLCPICRRQRRLAHWPFGILQKRQCDASGETIISVFSKHTHFPVYQRKIWFSDSWEAPQAEVDFCRSFFDQLYELQQRTPHFHQLGQDHINCDYADDVWECRNLYLCRSAYRNEDLLYSYRVLNSRDSVDLTYCFDCECSYECTYCFNCSNLLFSLNCRECRDSYFLYDCRGTSDSFMCWNLRNKQYYIFNQYVGKKEFESRLASLGLSSWVRLDEYARQFQHNIAQQAVHRAHLNYQVENCSGNYLSNCKDCEESYFLSGGRDCWHIFRGHNNYDCMDTSGLLEGEQCYEICQSTNLNNVQFAVYSVNCHDCQYIDQCFDSSDLFGCVGLRRKRFCILNKQYTQSDYSEIVTKLKTQMKQRGEYGEFFPYRFAYTGFNLSLGSFYYDETSETIKQKGGYFELLPEAEVGDTPMLDVPDETKSISDELLNRAVICQGTGRPYRFIKQELDFYQQHSLPVPRLCPEARNIKRFSLLATADSRESCCHICKQPTDTFYPEHLDWKNIACEDCYLKVVY